MFNFFDTLLLVGLLSLPKCPLSVIAALKAQIRGYPENIEGMFSQILRCERVRVLPLAPRLGCGRVLSTPVESVR